MALPNVQQNSTYQPQNMGEQQYRDSGNSNDPVFTEMKSIVAQEQTNYQHFQQSQMISVNDSSQSLHLPIQTSGYRIINNMEHNSDSQLTYLNTQQIPVNSNPQYNYLSQNLSSSENNKSNEIYQVLNNFFLKNIIFRLFNNLNNQLNFYQIIKLLIILQIPTQ